MHGIASKLEEKRSVPVVRNGKSSCNRVGMLCKMRWWETPPPYHNGDNGDDSPMVHWNSEHYPHPIERLRQVFNSILQPRTHCRRKCPPADGHWRNTHSHLAHPRAPTLRILRVRATSVINGGR
ncbi:uncharacterized protein KIAA0947-like protein [Anopheles sinensis]|uniref:Uncharacterized protein KIAA0947-like protein n=1 Tax=Anopheles sinensis TaxID=74873 RepID=A0A084WDF1_ANOSI|nr:uncharacterized protein KIAA0947-like protein [Anopheles sinensis]